PAIDRDCRSHHAIPRNGQKPKFVMHVCAILLSTRNSDTRSITRTVRIDEDVQDAIEHIAEQQNLSVNALVNKALRKFAFWDTALEKFEAVSTPSQLLVKMMSISPPRMRRISPGQPGQTSLRNSHSSC